MQGPGRATSGRACTAGAEAAAAGGAASTAVTRDDVEMRLQFFNSASASAAGTWPSGGNPAALTTSPPRT